MCLMGFLKSQREKYYFNNDLWSIEKKKKEYEAQAQREGNYGCKQVKWQHLCKQMIQFCRAGLRHENLFKSWNKGNKNEQHIPRKIYSTCSMQIHLPPASTREPCVTNSRVKTTIRRKNCHARSTWRRLGILIVSSLSPRKKPPELTLSNGNQIAVHEKINILQTNKLGHWFLTSSRVMSCT